MSPDIFVICAVRLEGNGRERWGGVWEAPRHYTLNSSHSDQTDVTLQVQFDADSWSSVQITKAVPGKDELKRMICMEFTHITSRWRVGICQHRICKVYLHRYFHLHSIPHGDFHKTCSNGYWLRSAGLGLQMR